MDEDFSTPAHLRKPAGPVSAAYHGLLRVLLAHPFAAIIISLVFAAGAIGVFNATPRELTPPEDRGRVFLRVSPQDGSNFQFLDRKMLEIESRLMPMLEDGGVESVIVVAGGGGSRPSAFAILQLADWSERTITQRAVEHEVLERVADVSGVTTRIGGGNSLGIRGGGQGLQFAVVGDDYDLAAAGADALIAELQKSETFANVRTDFQTSQPQITVDIDREAATALGVPVSVITRTIQVMADEFRAADIFQGDDIIEVLVSGAGEPVNDPTDLSNIYLRARTGDIVPLSSVASIREVAVAANLGREARRRAAPVTAGLADGVTLGDAVSEMRAVADDVLEGALSVVLLGEARVLQESNSATFIVFGFAALIVFLVLAAQFESFVSALIIMVTVPFGLAAAVYAIYLTGGSINYYSQIGLVLLIGVMAKNGILVVEFANQQRDRGESVREAIEHAAMTRLRPVLMTALSTLLASLPLIFGAGAGAESRAALGWVIFGGLGFSTVFTLFLTPVSFLLLAGLSKPRAAEGAKVAEEMAKVTR
jgi:HAE1 family hydrophobic/amphiphilic exporter-1